MKENKHTPGPWRVFEGKQTWIEAPGSEPSSRVTIAVLHETSTKLSQEPRLPHDAQLIASAPELLGALEWFVEFAAQHPEWMENFLAHEDSAEREWFNAVRQAIAKAKGGV